MNKLESCEYIALIPVSSRHRGGNDVIAAGHEYFCSMIAVVKLLIFKEWLIIISPLFGFGIPTKLLTHERHMEKRAHMGDFN